MNINATAQNWAPRILSLLRIVVGLLILQHGLQKIFNFPPAPTPHPYVLMSLVPGLAGLIETIGGILVLLGLFTRPAAFIVAGEMAVAFFMVHFPKSPFPILNGGDGAVIFCWVFFYIAFAGAGPWSLDAMMDKKAVAA